MSDKLRAIVIGCGRIGSEISDDSRTGGIQSHAGAYTKCSDTILSGLFDPDSTRLKKAKKKWGSPDTDVTLDVLLDRVRPDLVSICSPNETHKSILKQVSDCSSVKGVLVEKPLALTVHDAREVSSYAENKGIIVAVNYSRRYSSSFRSLKRFIENGKIGAIQSVSGYYTKGLVHNGTHWLDLARFLIGEIGEVRGLPSVDDQGPDIELLFEKGGRGSLRNLDAVHFSLFEMDVIGTKGRVKILDSGYKIESFAVRADPNAIGYQTLVPSLLPIDGGMTDVMLYAVQNLVNAIQKKEPVYCSSHDAIIALEIAETAFSTLKSKNTGLVKLHYPGRN